jgi:predicted outer membrane repeat protein
MMSRSISIVVVGAVSLSSICSSFSFAGSQPQNVAGVVGGAGRAAQAPSRHPTQLIVRFKPGAALSVKSAAIAAVPQAKTVRSYHCVDGLQLIDVPKGRMEEALKTLRKNPNIRYAEPDYLITLSQIPNDPLLPELWGLRNTGQTVDGDPGTAGIDIRAPEAWQVWTGDASFRIAVIDSGVDYTHPDLAANIWTNPGEIAGNGIDDDGNGYIDDIHGYDFLNRDGDPMDDNRHGTHVAGTIGAVGNDGVGIVGVNWRCKIVALKFLSAGGSGPTSAAAEAIQYAIDNGIRLSNNSWGSSAFSSGLRDVIQAARDAGHLFVAAAGNSSANNDIFPHYPASYDLENIISVAAIDNDGALAGFSNYGVASVDLAAPGVRVYSSVPGPGYAYLNGTSMASPHVAGVAALLMSRVPDWDWRQVRDQILGTTAPLPGFSVRVATGGMVDAQVAVGDCNRNGVADDIDITNGTSIDCSGNGTPDECEADCNGNGLADSCDILNASSEDCTSNGIPDECEADCNANGQADSCDLFFGLDSDCDLDGVPDGCELDCNGNGVNDTCDIRTGSSVDCTTNGIPDECEADCNGNGRADTCDLDDGTSIDCNENGVPDACDIAAGGSADCTSNGVPDECEYDCNANGRADSCDIADGFLADTDGDGIADVCKLGFAIVPVDSSGPHTIEGDRIYLTQGDQRVTFEIRLSGWAPGGALDTPLEFYQAAIDAQSFVNGIGGATTYAKFPCTTDVQCRPSFAQPGTPRCIDGFCDDASAVFVDMSKPDYVFAGLDSFVFTILNAGYPPFVGSVLLGGPTPPDRGQQRYGATLLVDVPAAAAGPYVVELDPGLSEFPLTFWGGAEGALIPMRGLASAAIVLPSDCDGDGIDDACETDCGVAGGLCDVPGCGTETDCNENLIPDSCPGVEVDCNANSIPDSCDIAVGTSVDCNNNRVPDECDVGTLDCNSNGIPDDCDITSGASPDCTNNGIPDECEALPDCNGNGTSDDNDLCERTSLDCNGNLLPDECDLDSGFANDCNENNVPDVCDVTARTSQDCNVNGEPDECDIAAGTSADCNDDGEPDECAGLTLDCNGNGLPDTCDIAAGTSEDCNQNLLPDECEDCNENGVADDCDLGAGTSIDLNGNGLPDECDFFLFVDQYASGANDGISWSNAFNDLQDALDAAADPMSKTTEIWIADGVYRADRGSGDRVATFSMVDGVTLYGGFAGGELLRSAADPTANETILCGDLLEDDAMESFDRAGFEACLSVQGVPYAPGCAPFDFDNDGDVDPTDELFGMRITDNSIHVVTVGEGILSGGLDGLTIRRGSSKTGSTPQGGGVYALGRVTISRCIIAENNAGSGAGAYGGTTDCDFNITDTIFRDNRAGNLGGGFYDGGGRADLVNCTFVSNWGNRGGAGGLSDTSSARNCLFIDNAAANLGGGLIISGTQPAVIVGCTFVGNHSDFRGGATYIENGQAVFSGSIFRNNTAAHGAATLIRTGSGTFVNCLFSGNQAVSNGGAINMGYEAEGIFQNCTFSRNVAGGNGGAIMFSDSSGRGLLTSSNSIYWGNTGFGAPERKQIHLPDGLVDINYNCIEGWSGAFGGVGNHGNDPLFADADGPDDIAGTEDDDVSLMSGSPAIDAGSNDLVPADIADVDADGDTSEQTPLDLLGTLRFLDDPTVPDTGAGFYPIVDMGAIEAGTDCNGNGIADTVDIANGTSDDCSGNGIPDECEPDCNASGVADSCDLINGTALDCNNNKIPDACDIDAQRSEDCNINGVPDECDPDGDSDGAIDDCDGCPTDPKKFAPGVCGCGIADTDSDNDTVPNCVDICPGGDDLVDSDGDSVPDACDRCAGFDDQFDDDADTVPNGCDQCPGFDDRFDDDSDGVPDDCDQCPGFDDNLDCNGNGTADACELQDQNSADANNNGVPDECDPPIAFGVSSRYISVMPGPGTDPVAFAVSSPDAPCVGGYIDFDPDPELAALGMGVIVGQPVYRSVAQWGVIRVRSLRIVPATLYRVRSITLSAFGPVTSAASETTTTLRGDVDANGMVNVFDITWTVDHVKAIPGLEVPRWAADVSPCLPDGTLNVFDITVSVDAVKQLDDPCDQACP